MISMRFYYLRKDHLTDLYFSRHFPVFTSFPTNTVCNFQIKILSWSEIHDMMLAVTMKIIPQRRVYLTVRHGKISALANGLDNSEDT